MSNLTFDDLRVIAEGTIKDDYQNSSRKQLEDQLSRLTTVPTPRPNKVVLTPRT